MLYFLNFPQLPKSSDEVFIQKLYQEHLKGTSSGKGEGQEQKRYFGKPRTAMDQFIIYHSSDKVCYTVWSFVEKNQDRVIPQHLAMLRASQSLFLCELFKGTGSGGDTCSQKKGFFGRKGAKGKSLAGPSVGAQVCTCTYSNVPNVAYYSVLYAMCDIVYSLRIL